MRWKSPLANFNPRSHEGSDRVQKQRINITFISIRAPARGATEKKDSQARREVISIRAPARGATNAEVITGSDTGISIRAPARGATYNAVSPIIINLFQSALPRGERPMQRYLDADGKIISIRAPARGATNSRIGQSGRSYNFNPRSREGNDTLVNYFQVSSDISIRAPARGATIPRGATVIIDGISIRAPARGATCLDFLVGSFLQNFNPRSREGSDGFLFF